MPSIGLAQEGWTCESDDALHYIYILESWSANSAASTQDPK